MGGVYMRWFKKLMHVTLAFIKAMFRLITGLRTPKGLIALFISFTIFYGWALAFIIYGTIIANPWFISIGTGVVIFWIAPGTPFFPIVIIATLFIQRVVLRDKKTQSFRKVYHQFAGDSNTEANEEYIALVEDKTDFADPKPDELEKSNRLKDAEVCDKIEVEAIKLDFIKKNNHIYSLNESGDMTSEVTFPLDGKHVLINRTFVDPSLRGQGVANLLLEAAYESIKAQNLKAIPTCTYAVAWFKRNKDKHDVLVKGIDLDNPELLLHEDCEI